MPFRKSPSMDRTGVERMAEGWGKVVARRVHEEVGPDLDLDADDIEQMAATAARAVARGTIVDLLERKAALLGPEQPCPTCRRLCAVRREPRTIAFWGGEVAYAEPRCHCPACRRDFFPSRPALRLTPHDYSPSVLGKIVRSAAREPSFREAAEAVADLAEVSISGRQVGRIAQEVGQQLQAARDDQVSRFEAGTLEPRVETRPALAVVEVDGGRLQIRGEGEGPGAHQAGWREDKVAILATMAGVASDGDPEPELPACFRDRGFVEEVIGAIGGAGPMGPPGPEADGPLELPIPAVAGSAQPRRVPELSVRTYVATTSPCDRFGPMVAAEARRRNFSEAAARAFLGDGSAWIWGLHAACISRPSWRSSISSMPWATCSRRPRPRRPTPRGAGSYSRPGRRPAGRGAWTR